MASSGFKGQGLLWRLLDSDQDGSLETVAGDAAEQMAEIEKTAKEVGGKPTRSARYLDARAVHHHIAQLRSIANGTYTHTLSGDEA